jgi:hypothetical protein
MVIKGMEKDMVMDMDTGRDMEHLVDVDQVDKADQGWLINS